MTSHLILYTVTIHTGPPTYSMYSNSSHTLCNYFLMACPLAVEHFPKEVNECSIKVFYDLDGNCNCKSCHQ